MLRTFRLLALLALCLSAPAFAQLTVGSLIFTNPGPYKQADLEAVAGLHRGSPLDKSILDAAAQRLNDTGVFDDIQFMTEGPNNAVNIHFDLTPSNPHKLLPLEFTNFPWWSDDEIMASLNGKVPLFQGTVPTSGSVRTGIERALEALVATKGVTATVKSGVIPEAQGVRRTAVYYSIDTPKVQIGTIKLAGQNPEMGAKIDKLTEDLGRHGYFEVGGAMGDRLAKAFHDEGYLDATISDLHRIPTGTGPVLVDLNATVVPGGLYRISKIDFADTPVVPGAELLRKTQLKEGQPALDLSVSAATTAIKDRYGREGYVTPDIKIVPKLDAEKHLVAYHYDIVPGPQYHLRSVKTTHLPASETAKFQADFPLKPGDLYNTDLLADFRAKWKSQHHTATIHLYDPTPDRAAQQVDLIVVFGDPE